MDIIIRSYQSTPVLSGRKIEGYAIVFNQRSELLYEGGRRFREIIQPGAVSMQMLDRCDIRMLLEHDAARLLARSRQGQGTLSYSIDSHGVKFSFEAPLTADGDYAVEMIRRGDISGSSFAFSLAKGGDRWKQESNGIYLRTITSIGYISDLSVVSNPAYSGTNADVRSRKDGKISQLQMKKNQLSLDEAEATAIQERQRFVNEQILQHSLKRMKENARFVEEIERERREMDAKREALKKMPKKHPDSIHWWE